MDELWTRVARRAPEAMAVAPIPDGFDVDYRESLVKRGTVWTTASTVRGVVACDPATRTLTLTDAGVVKHDSLTSRRVSAAGFRGRASAMRTVDAYGVLPDGSWGKVVAIIAGIAVAWGPVAVLAMTGAFT